MTPEKRIVAAVKTLEAVRTNINQLQGKYSGSMAPNLQSVVDILTLPDAVLEEQLAAAAQQFTCAQVSDQEIDALKQSWDSLCFHD